MYPFFPSILAAIAERQSWKYNLHTKTKQNKRKEDLCNLPKEKDLNSLSVENIDVQQTNVLRVYLHGSCLLRQSGLFVKTSFQLFQSYIWLQCFLFLSIHFLLLIQAWVTEAAVYAKTSKHPSSWPIPQTSLANPNTCFRYWLDEANRTASSTKSREEILTSSCPLVFASTTSLIRVYLICHQLSTASGVSQTSQTFFTSW